MMSQFVVADGQLCAATGYLKPEGGTILYEVVRVTDGAILFLDDHLDRLARSAQLAGVSLSFSREEIMLQLAQLLQATHIKTGNIQLVFQYRQEVPQHQGIFFIPHHYPSKADYRNGVKTILFRAERENPNAKIIQQILRDRINEQITREKAYEAILVHPEGYITEGSRSNFFMIRNATVYTAPEADILPGITRKYVLQICRELAIPFVEKRIVSETLSRMDAAFLSGTSPKILPVSEVAHFRFDPTDATLRKIMQQYDILSGKSIC